MYRFDLETGVAPAGFLSGPYFEHAHACLSGGMRPYGLPVKCAPLPPAHVLAVCAVYRPGQHVPSGFVVHALESAIHMNAMVRDSGKAPVLCPCGLAETWDVARVRMATLSKELRERNRLSDNRKNATKPAPTTGAAAGEQRT